MQSLPAILILAAGASRRMAGADKLLQDIDGQTLLRRQAKAALASGAAVYVTCNPEKPERNTCLADLPVTCVPVPDAAEGMGQSLATGVASLSEATPGVLILPADMPDITAEDLGLCISAWVKDPDKVLQATSATGKPGHPVIFPRRLFQALTQLTGDQGARDVLKTEYVRQLPLPVDHATTDLDTTEEWATWRLLRAQNK